MPRRQGSRLITVAGFVRPHFRAGVGAAVDIPPFDPH